MIGIISLRSVTVTACLSLQYECDKLEGGTVSLVSNINSQPHHNQA